MKNLLYASAARRRSVAVIRSNASLLDLDCSSLTGWTDGDTGEAVSDQTTFNGESTFSFDTNTSADTNDQAARTKDIGSIEGLGNQVTISSRSYSDAIGTIAGGDYFIIEVERSDLKITIAFASDGLFIHDGGSWIEAGTNLVLQDQWQEWTFDCDVSVVASATCDIYLNNSLKASGVDASFTGSYTDGLIGLKQRGYATDNMITYVDYLKIGDGLV